MDSEDMSRTAGEMFDFFEKHSNVNASDLSGLEWLEFERVKVKLSRRPDLHAFILLDKLVPCEAGKASGLSNIVEWSDGDGIWLSIDVKKLAAIATDEQLLDLIRCGVLYDYNHDSLYMLKDPA